MGKNLIPILMDTTSAAEQTAEMPWWYQYMSIFMIVALVLVMYFVMIRPQKKRQKEEQKMRNSIRVGDEITTIGGICGRVVTVREDALVIETGADRNKMSIKKWAVQANETVHDDKDVDNDDDDDDDDI